MPCGLALAVTPLVATPLAIWVAARTRLGAVVLAIALDAFLLLDFTGTILGTLTFHRRSPFLRIPPLLPLSVICSAMPPPQYKVTQEQ